MVRPLPMTVALALALAGEGVADEVFLRGGGHLVGDIVRRDARWVVVDVDIGHVTLPAAHVERIVPGERTAYAQYRDRAARLAADDLDGWLGLAVWARASHLATPARTAFLRALEIDPASTAAHEGLGHVRVGDRWMTVDEAWRARGYVRHEGRWMTPAERDVKVRESEARALREREERARDEAEAAARETKVRLRDLEARVKEAEARAREAEARADERETEARDLRERDHHRRRRARASCERPVVVPPSASAFRAEVFTVCQVNGQPRFCVPVPRCGHAGHGAGRCPF